MISGIVLSLTLLTSIGQGSLLQQTTSGWCSPNMVPMGDVTISCIGVDPRALRVLNKRLAAMEGTLEQKLREANDWAARYHELEQRLAENQGHSELSRQAQEYVHEGKYEEAKAILDKMLTNDEQLIAQAAQNHYNRGQIFELQSQPREALPHYQQPSLSTQ